MCLVKTFLSRRGEFRTYAFYLCHDNNESDDIVQDAFIKISRAQQNGNTFSCSEQEVSYIKRAINTLNIDRARMKYGTRSTENSKKAEVLISSEELYGFFITHGISEGPEVEEKLEREHERVTLWARKELCLELLNDYHPHIKQTFKYRLKGVPFNKIAEKRKKSLNTVLGEFRYAMLFLKKKIDDIEQQTGRPILEAV